MGLILVKKGQRAVKFGHLNVGDVFEHKGIWYQKIFITRSKDMIEVVMLNLNSGIAGDIEIAKEELVLQALKGEEFLIG